ncbi:sigma-B regulation protein RsbU (phosphoserine phosphatase) [Dongia mobilis]|uniref:Sigma-B regulation protein RsbU (Phosphoserine phosphatase) n=1 Tax=Dongia mobilis TaxID=578943 RepID=A0A4R6WPU1_9PROT|nr:SpoIIE family protein phosphatase [Dongia mobilis]TDQ83261.1 sigma-B regulation protein RsbU (phosphoserine phosphatase) [Dongia mobilis]
MASSISDTGNNTDRTIDAGSVQPGDSSALDFAASLARSFAASLNVDATVRQALGSIIQLLETEAGSLFLIDDAGSQLICRASAGPVKIDGLTVPLGQGIVGRTVAEDRLIAVEDAYEDRSFFKAADQRTGFHTRSVLCAPMRVGEKLIGAVQVLNKRSGHPFDARDSNMLQVMANAAALAISNARLADQLLEQERIKRELELASEIQRSLLPGVDSDLPICGINRPIREVSGDFYDYFELPDGTIAFALGDVSGKGMNAALLMAKTASLFRCLGKTIRDPARLLSILNREICETTSRGMFCTMLAGLYEPATGLLRYANAGHLPPLIKFPDRLYETVAPDAPPLGIVSDAQFVDHEINLNGGLFVAFSDGLTEFRYGEEELGTDGLNLLLDNAQHKPIAQRLDAVLRELDQGGWQARDDLTLLAIDDCTAGRAFQRDHRGDPAAPTEAEFLFGLSFMAEPSRLKLMRASLRAAARACRFDEDEIQDLLLAAGEAVENIMIHAYGSGKKGEITLAVHRLPDGIMLRLRDFAPRVDAAKIEPRPLDEVRPGGLGTHFIRAIMDDASFIPLPDGEGNLLELVKRRRTGPETVGDSPAGVPPDSGVSPDSGGGSDSPRGKPGVGMDSKDRI